MIGLAVACCILHSVWQVMRPLLVVEIEIVVEVRTALGALRIPLGGRSVLLQLRSWLQVWLLPQWSHPSMKTVQWLPLAERCLQLQRVCWTPQVVLAIVMLQAIVVALRGYIRRVEANLARRSAQVGGILGWLEAHSDGWVAQPRSPRQRGARRGPLSPFGVPGMQLDHRVCLRECLVQIVSDEEE